MNVITITREYGAGGGEVARKLADDPRLGTAGSRTAPPGGRGRAPARCRTGAARRKSHRHGRPLPLASAASEVSPRAEAGSGERGDTGQRGPRRPRGQASAGRAARRAPPAAGRPQAVAGPADVGVGRLALDESLARLTEMDRIRGRFARYFFGDKAAPTGGVRPGLQHRAGSSR